MKKTLVPVVMLTCLSLPCATAPARAAGDAAAGKTVFKQCRPCHQVGPDAQNSVGPVLNGVFGRKAGQYPGYNYSNANKSSGIVWNEENLNEYLKNPRVKVPGTKMVFPGIPQDSRRENLIAYLKGIKADGSGAGDD